MTFNKIVETPIEPCAAPPAGNRGGPGTYDGEPGFPGRTGSSDGVPEKVRDSSGPLAQNRD